MSANKSSNIIILLLVIPYLTVSSLNDTMHGINNLMFSRISDDASKEKNETNFSEKFVDINSTNTTENLFWTISNEKEATESNIKFHNNTVKVISEVTDNNIKYSDQINGALSASIKPTKNAVINNENEDRFTQNVWLNATINEIITLERSNCHLEIDIQENYDLKTEIRFGKLENNTSGKCCITLNGQVNTRLGLLISNVHLHQYGSEGEILKVIIATYGLDFLLKEYSAWSSYQPLLLTETHKVYLILYYNVTEVPVNNQDSFFHLEVFSYYT